jgi:RES domain-containing protein
MRVYRISKEEFVASALLGIGAAMAPGRWNSAGVHLAYTAGSESLAMLEMLVHVNLSDVPEDRLLLTYELPDDGIHDLPKAHWPEGWDAFPYSGLVREIGDTFITNGQHLALRVPSAIVRNENNVLINPRHPRFAEIVLVDQAALAPDPRLFK